MLFIKVRALDTPVQVYYWIVPDTFLKRDPTGAEVVRYGKVVGKFENEVVAFSTEDYYEHVWNRIYIAAVQKHCIDKVIKRRFVVYRCLFYIWCDGGKV